MQNSKFRRFLLGLTSSALVAVSIVTLGNSASATSTAVGTYQLSVGDYYACAVDTAGLVQCWGKNDVGQLGRGTASSTDENVGPVSGLTDVIAVAAGYSPTACAIKNNGTVWCWGEGSHGQLGNGADLDSSVPVQVTGITTAKQIAVGVKTACAILIDETISCWGVIAHSADYWMANAYTLSNVPAALSPTDTSVRFKDIEMGRWSSCAIATTGTQYCWGRNRGGQLGTGSDMPTALAVPTPDSVVTDSHAIGLSEDSICTVHGSPAEVICRGDGYYGEMGNGSHTSFGNVTPQYPQTADGTHLGNAIALAGSQVTHCALKSDKTVWCWGNNDSKQRGLDSVDLFINQVSGLTDAVAISGGWQHFCAVLSDASVACWGRNGDNELGNGTGLNSITPVTVSGLTVLRSTASNAPSPSSSASSTSTPSSTPSATPTVRPTRTATLRQLPLSTLKLKKKQVLSGTTAQGALVTITKVSGDCRVVAAGSGTRKSYTLYASTKSAGKCTIRITAPVYGTYKAYAKSFVIAMKK